MISSKNKSLARYELDTPIPIKINIEVARTFLQRSQILSIS